LHGLYALQHAITGWGHGADTHSLYLECGCAFVSGVAAVIISARSGIKSTPFPPLLPRTANVAPVLPLSKPG